jgi:hypothetical protein
MDTHFDNQHRSKFMDTLRSRAIEAKAEKISMITSEGTPICEWQGKNGMFCRRLPDDEQGILRISIGGGEDLPVTLNYLSVRGKIGQCIALMEKALSALRECPE